MQTQIFASGRTIIATGTNSRFPALSESAAAERWVDLRVRGLAGDAASKLESIPTLGRAA